MLLVEQQKGILDFFKKIECSDESFFGTIFRATNKENFFHGTTLINWKGRGLVGYISHEFLEGNNAKNEFFFARKFKADNVEVFDRINEFDGEV